MDVYIQVCISDVEQDADLHNITATVATTVGAALPFNAVTAEVEDVQ